MHHNAIQTQVYDMPCKYTLIGIMSVPRPWSAYLTLVTTQTPEVDKICKHTISYKH